MDSGFGYPAKNPRRASPLLATEWKKFSTRRSISGVFALAITGGNAGSFLDSGSDYQIRHHLKWLMFPITNLSEVTIGKRGVTYSCTATLC